MSIYLKVINHTLKLNIKHILENNEFIINKTFETLKTYIKSNKKNKILNIKYIPHNSSYNPKLFEN